MTTRDDLIKAMEQTAIIKPTPVQTKKWGTVYVRSLTVAEVDEQTDDTADKNDKRKFARGACRVICDESGTLLFDATNDADVALIAKQPWEMLHQVLSASGSDDLEK